MTAIDPQDYVDIRQAMARYCRALDRMDGALLRSIFHADAAIDMGALYQGGLDGFVHVALSFMAAMKTTRHEAGLSTVEHGVGGLAAETYVRAWHVVEAQAGLVELVVLARYLNTFTRQGGRLLIASHSEVVDWGEERPVSAAWFEGNRELPKGVRTPEDPTYRLFAPGASA